MYFTYLFRELSKRSKQTSLIATGLALGIALVVLVTSVSGGIKSAQAEALSGLYGIGTDISVTKTATPGDFQQRFNVAGSQSTGTKRSFSRSRLEIDRFSGTLTDAEVKGIAAAAGVKASVATVKLNSVTFSGTLPTFNRQSGNAGQMQPGQMPNGGQTSGTGTRPQGGFDGKGGSSFNVTSFSVEGVGLETNKLGPLSAVKVSSGRAFASSDAGTYVAELDSNYATTAKLKVGSSITLGDKKFQVIGVLKSTSVTATTPSNVYIPIDVAQKLSGQDGVYTNVYVAANSSNNLDSVKKAIEKVVPKATVATSAELASTVTGSIASAATLVNVMGTWLSWIVLAAAFGLAILFTTSGVNRRTREFGTLKAIGWKSSRVVGQVVGESIFTGILGGAIGVLLGLGAVWAVNSFAPALTASAASSMPRPGGQMGFGRPPGMMQQVASGVSLTLHANLDFTIIASAIGLAVIGGLLAGIFGGLRAARLSPATALRSFE
jgi:putative ABC transport system permease protein